GQTRYETILASRPKGQARYTLRGGTRFALPIPENGCAGDSVFPAVAAFGDHYAVSWMHWPDPTSIAGNMEIGYGDGTVALPDVELVDASLVQAPDDPDKL